jgi:hypothetical protein
MHVHVTPGVTIGDGAVIGMGAVVSKDVPAGAVVVGSPMRVVKHRDMDHFATLDRAGLRLGREGFVKPPQVDFPKLDAARAGTVSRAGSDTGGSAYRDFVARVEPVSASDLRVYTLFQN